MLLTEDTIEVASRIFHSIHGVSSDATEFWNTLIKVAAHDDLTDAQVEQRQIIGGSNPLKNPEQIKETFLSLTGDQQRQVFASLSLAQDEARRTNDIASANAIENVLSKLPNMEATEITNLYVQRVKSFQNSRVFYVDRKIRAASFDFMLKCCALIFIVSTGLESNLNFNTSLVISWISIIVAWRISRADQKANVALLNARLPDKPWKLVFRNSRTQYTLLTIYIVCSAIIGFVLGGDHTFGMALGMLVIVSAFYFLMIVVFPAGRLTPDSVEAQLQETDSLLGTGADENDELIVKLETKLQSQTSRLEAYVLESALFGALAFSGFLQIIATNLISFADLENFAEAVFNSIHGLLAGQPSEFHQGAAVLSTKESLFCLVSIETLVCSGLFLAVIASRLRFSNFSDSIRTSLSLAAAYNEKEEAMLGQESFEPTK